MSGGDVRDSEPCQRLGRIEGIADSGDALIAPVGDRTGFKYGRRFAAWLGLVPQQRSSGGRVRLFGISKRGDRYLLRTLMIHGVAPLWRNGSLSEHARWQTERRRRPGTAEQI
ncbi:transposase (fragment) [Mesorhizobium sp. ORS 3359]